MIDIEKINQEWAPIKWAVIEEEKSYAVLATIKQNILIKAQVNSDNSKLYAFRYEGTVEAMKNFILNGESK